MTKILDTTLRDGLLNRDYRVDEEDKKKIAHLLERSGIEVIEIAHITESTDIDSVVKLGKAIEHSEICILSDFDVQNLEKSAMILEKLPETRLHLYSTANVVEAEYHQAVFGVSQAVSFMSQYTKNIQWTGFDGNRADFQSYRDQIEMAIDCGVKTLSIPDSHGVSDPLSFHALIDRVKAEVPNINLAALSVHCHDDLGHSFENTRIAAESGVDQAECTVLGIGARKGNCNTLDFAKYLNGISHRYNLDRIREAERLLEINADI